MNKYNKHFSTAPRSRCETAQPGNLYTRVLTSSVSFSASNDFDSLGECYEELESSWSGSAASSNGPSRTGYSSTLPGNGKQQRFSFFFGNGLGESKNKEMNKSCVDTTDFPNGKSQYLRILMNTRVYIA